MKGIAETIRKNKNLDTITCKKGKQLFDINQSVKGVYMITKNCDVIREERTRTAS